MDKADPAIKRSLSPESKLLLYLLAGFILFVCLIYPTGVATCEKWQIDTAVRNAKSIEIVHFNPYCRAPFQKEIIYGTKILKKEDFHKVSDAFPYCLDISCPLIMTMCSFDPHHRIVITDASGQQKVIQVCFICTHVQVGEKGGIIPMPFLWISPLHRFFKEEGLPYQPDRYQEDMRHGQENHP